ncbi:MAG: hypothetical protein QXN90_02390 [Zestosphaera sp.]
MERLLNTQSKEGEKNTLLTLGISLPTYRKRSSSKTLWSILKKDQYRVERFHNAQGPRSSWMY